MKHFTLFIISLTICNITLSQTLIGKVISKNGDAVPYATIFIYELTQGIVVDDQGNFQTKLQSGIYNCEIRSIGYETQKKTISIEIGLNEIQFVLNDKPLVLNEVTVNPSKENPAKRVILQAIAHAPLFLYQVKEYSANNYMKGSAKIEKIPSLMKMVIKDKKLESLIGRLLVLESQSEIRFTSPSKYVQKVIAFKSSIPKELTPKGGIRTSTSSIYQPEFMGYISPLSPNAFQYYRFKLIEIFTSDNHQVNKISIEPKLKNEQLLRGFIYIVENDWNVFHLDLTANEMGTTTRYKITFSEVKPQVFLPVSYEMHTNIGTAGVKGKADYYSSIQYLTINQNTSSKLNMNIVNQNFGSGLKNKNSDNILKNIELINSKKDLTTKKTKIISKLLTKTLEPEEVTTERESLEVIETEKVKLNIDSLAEMRDSIFWENVRKVPIQKEESLSFLVIDTMPPSKKVSTTNNSITVSLSAKSTKAVNWLLGSNFKLNEKVELKYDGFLRGILKEYNFVDGFWIGQKVSLNIKTSKYNNLHISPSAYYTTASKSIHWNLNSIYNYSPISNGNLSINIGSTTSDIQGDIGSSRLLNSISSLFSGNNVILFYQKQFFNIENKIDIANGFIFNTGISYENRNLPHNNTNLHFWGKIPQQNYPDLTYKQDFPSNVATTATVNLQYTPKYKYKIMDGRKIYLNSKFPTFGLEYKKGITISNLSEQAEYDRIKLTINQMLKLSSFNILKYRLQAGSYLNDKKLYSPDLNYFSTNPLFITGHSFDNSFQLLNNYTFSRKQWLEVHLNFHGDYLLLKRLRFLQTQKFNESLHLKFLLSEEFSIPYVETGYSIGFQDFARIGVFGSLNGFRFDNIGFKVSISLLK